MRAGVPRRPDQGALDELLPLVGELAEPVHMPTGEGHGGGDVDCLVWGLDRTWPVRAPRGWRLAQIIRYDSVAWYWVFEHDGEVLAIDTLCDPDGVGQYSWPVTAELFPLTAGIRAAYLTAKRLRKEIRDDAEWERIRALAEEDPDAFGRSLEGPFGAVAHALADEVLAGGVPHRLWARARAVQTRRRIRTPGRAARLVIGQLARAAGRAAQPTGFHLLLVGPDGTGKSSLSSALRASCAPLFRRTEALHWRPGLLPRPGALAGRPERDPTDPHGEDERGRVLSLAFASYHWLDFFAGSWTRLQARRIRSTFVVHERGWHDIAVDPRRYRLRVPPGFVRVLGRLLPRPDLVCVLRASPEVAAARKAELGHDEIDRQTREWLARPPPARRVVVVDADQAPEQVERTVREAVVSTLNVRALGRLGGGWAPLPRSTNPRWRIPRRPPSAAAGGMRVYHPVTPFGLWGWRTARALARAGALPLFTRRAAIPEEVRGVIASHVPRGGSVSILRANHPGRHVALICDRSGAPQLIAKLAFDEHGIAALQREQDALEGIARLLPPPLRAPVVRDAGSGLLVTGAARWRARRRPWLIDAEVAAALGTWFRAGGETTGHGHGDFAPWNLLQTDAGWTLVDWEEARPDAPPFDDVFHHVVQSHALLGRPSEDDVVAALRREGVAGVAVAAYADAAGLRDGPSIEGFVDYLRRSYDALPAATPDGAAGRAARARLAARLGRPLS